MARLQKLSKANAKRQVMGISYEALAVRAMLPVSTIRSYLKRDRVRQVEVANDIAKALESDLSIFLP